MFVTRAVLLVALAQMWVVAPLFGPVRWAAGLAVALMMALSVRGNLRSGEGWGFARGAMLPAFGWAAALTLPAVALVLAAGLALGTLRMAGWGLSRFAVLLGWALVQQFVLQTAILREARTTFGRQAALLLSPVLFALVHLPNPFLTPVTFVAARGWCWIYDRHPHLLPLALSHSCASLALVAAFGPQITGGMRVGYGYFLHHALWL